MIAHYLNLNLLQELGLNDLPAERKQQLAEKMTRVVEGRLTLQIKDALSEEDWQKFLQLSEMNDEVALVYLQQNIANFDLMVQETVAQYKSETLTLFNRVTELVN